VIDRELVSGRLNKPDINATAIYEIAGQKIKKIWFLKK
jgi:hypothetical protein